MSTPASPRDGTDTTDHDGPAVLRKVACRLLPLLALLYLVNYLDRVNISFAGPGGMNKALGLSATMFGFASGIFFVGYLLMEVPSNLILHTVGARRWLARIMITWGILATAMGFVPNATVLVILRFMLGVAEAGFFPGIILYLTYWFPTAFRTRAIGWFMVAIPISTALGSTLSGLILSGADGLFGLSGWRVMFLIEGIPAIILAFVTFFGLTDRPEKATWLTDRERTWLVGRLGTESRSVESFEHWPLRRALTHPRILVLAFVYFGITYGLYALGFFLPTIVAGFEQQFGTKLSITERSLVTAIPYAVAAVVMVAWSRWADTRAARGGDRRWMTAIPMIVGGAAVPVALYLRDPWSAMVAVTICAVGAVAALPTFWPLPSTFLTGAAAAGGIAMINSLGNVSGFVAPYVTGGLRDLTGSQRTGLWVVGIVMVIGALLALRVGGRHRDRQETEQSVDAQRLST